MRITRLQRKEARPTGAVLFLWLLFLIPIGSCGSSGTFKLTQARGAVVAVDDPARLSAASLGTYVAGDLLLQLDARSARTSAEEHGASEGLWAYGVAGAPNVRVLSKKPLFPEGLRFQRVRVEGQLCDSHAHLVCESPTEALLYLVELEKHGSGVRTVLAGKRPSDLTWEAWTGLGVAGFVLLMGLLGTALVVRAAARPGTLRLERAVSVRHSFEAVRGMLRAQAGAMWRVAHDSAEGMVLLVGKPTGAVRLSGATMPNEIPLRVDVDAMAGVGAYRGATVSVRVFELMPQSRLQQTVTSSFDVSRQAVEQAAARVVALCESA